MAEQGKQHLVLEADVFSQIAGEVVDALDELEQRLLRRARRIGRAKVVLQLQHGR